MIIILDDSYFPTSKQSNVDNASVIACVLLNEENKTLIVNIIEEVMQQFGLSGDLPLKYCIDERIEKEFRKRNRLKEYSILKKKHPIIIDEVIKRTASVPFHLMLAWNFVPIRLKKEKIGQERIRNTSECVITLIKHASNHLAQTCNGNEVSVFSDRFEKKQQNLIDQAITTLIEENRQQTPSNSIPQIYFGNSHHNRLLQFADLVVGILRKMIQDCIKERSILSPRCAQLIPKLIGYPNKIEGLGIIGPYKYQSIIKEAMENTVNSTPHLPPLME